MVARRKHNNAGFPRACRNAMHSETAFKQSKAGAAQLKYGHLQATQPHCASTSPSNLEAVGPM